MSGFMRMEKLWAAKDLTWAGLAVLFAGMSLARVPAPALAAPPPDCQTQAEGETLARASPDMTAWHIAIPDIGVDASVVPVWADTNCGMGVPDRPDVVGWYAPGPLPGARGNALLDGHVDWTNRETGIPFTGVFWELGALRPGAQVIISDGVNEYTYLVTEKRRYYWDDPQGASVLRATAQARITMITCGGIFDRATHNYSMRQIVIAELEE